jgi:transcriptional regulator with PAS, ATPase and Fis domain
MSTSISTTKVLLWETNLSRRHSLADTINSIGTSPIFIESKEDIQDQDDVFTVAVIGLGESAIETSDVLSITSQLKTRGCKILAYAPHVFSWPIAVRCRALLNGASLLFDSSSATFSDDLKRELGKILKAQSDERLEKELIRNRMKLVGIVGESPQMLSVFRWVARVSALSDFPILITGETGTGKELIANALHQLDPKRRTGPFVVTNCSAISAGLAESELFGHRRGAFTGADTDRKGLFRAAQGGILFLDEIAELTEPLQAKLLRVLQEKRVLGVGFDQEMPIDVRVIAATNRGLEKMVADGRFREDLYHRLNGLSVHVPPLRERAEDLQPLIEYFVERYSSLTTTKTRSVKLDFVEALAQVELPGNARQLENIVRSAMLNKIDDSPLSLSDLTPGVWREISNDQLRESEPLTASAFERTPTRDLQSYFRNILDENNWNLPRSLQYCEKVFLQCVLQSARGNQSRAARLIGITPRSVYNKLQKYKLRPSS